MKKVLIILFFASILIYAKAEAHVFYVYSEDIMFEYGKMEYVEAVEDAFMRAGHEITKDRNYGDFSVLVSVKEWVEDELWGLSKSEKVELTIIVSKPYRPEMIGRESAQGKKNNIDKLADKVVKNIRKYLKK